jgi:tetratricopeptide (TPR) repeat protein
MRKVGFSILLLLCAVSVLAYNPKPVAKSPAELKLAADLAVAQTDSVKIFLAKSAFELNPDDIPLGVIAQDVLLKKMDKPKEYYKQRADNDPTIAARFLYGRASGDSTTMELQAQAILKLSPNNYWGNLLAGLGAWEHEKSDDKLVQVDFEKAIAADPSRPESYFNLGWLFMDQKKWPEARAALDAGGVTDPSNTGIRNARLTVYAEQRDGKAYFDLIKGVFPETPLTVDLPRANGSGHVTNADWTGSPTVVEYWAYT